MLHAEPLLKINLPDFLIRALFEMAFSVNLLNICVKIISILSIFEFRNVGRKFTDAEVIPEYTGENHMSAHRKQ